MKWIFLVCALFVWSNALAQKRGYDTIPNVPDHYKVRLAKFRTEPVVLDKIMFVGNSITEGGNWRRLLKDSTVINRGISGDNTFGLLNRLDEIN